MVASPVPQPHKFHACYISCCDAEGHFISITFDVLIWLQGFPRYSLSIVSPSLWLFAGQESATQMLSFIKYKLISIFNGFNGLQQSLIENTSYLVTNIWEHKLAVSMLTCTCIKSGDVWAGVVPMWIHWWKLYTFHLILSLLTYAYSCDGESTCMLQSVLVCSSHFVLVLVSISNEILRDDTALWWRVTFYFLIPCYSVLHVLDGLHIRC